MKHSDAKQPKGLVMIAHGARTPGWDAPFQALLKSLQSRNDGVHYALAFMEQMQPPTAQAVAALIAQGCTEIMLVPMLLGVGAHARDDLPALLNAAKAAHPQVRFQLSRTLGEDALVLHALENFVTALAHTDKH